jgi:DNA topoisomerase I
MSGADLEMNISNAKLPDPDKQAPAELVYVSDKDPGISRVRRGRGFSYHRPDGGLLRDQDELDRIRGLGLPPAYRNVWICMLPEGHLQATGIDDRGRKQYRYHVEWLAYRNRTKFDQLIAFGEALPGMRRRILQHLQGEPFQERTVLAALCTLLDRAHLRVGSQAYVEENNTYGATTLLKRHLRLRGDQLELNFTGKGGKRVRRRLRHPTLSRVLEQVSDLPGRQLFVWRDSEDRLHPVDSGRLNGYLSRITGLAITAKTFRTWAGSVAAFSIARALIASGNKPTIKEMSEAAAETLSNTAAVCRSSYIHPAIIELSETNPPVSTSWFSRSFPVRRNFRVNEEYLLRFLKCYQRLRTTE